MLIVWVTTLSVGIDGHCRMWPFTAIKLSRVIGPGTSRHSSGNRSSSVTVIAHSSCGNNVKHSWTHHVTHRVNPCLSYSSTGSFFVSKLTRSVKEVGAIGSFRSPRCSLWPQLIVRYMLSTIFYLILLIVDNSIRRHCHNV